MPQTGAGFIHRAYGLGVTSIPASIFGIDKGLIAKGKAADLLLYDCEDGDPLNEFLALDAGKTQCLLRKGVPLYGDTSVVESFRVWGGSYASVEVSKRKKMVRGNLLRLIRRIYRQLPSPISMVSQSNSIRPLDGPCLSRNRSPQGDLRTCRQLPNLKVRE
ncbi:MAG: hypothetical protein NTZ35_05150 [Ignavibacteriales bacterium]|nr:hypothetical protein [Ignavibacteriales bacterium]